MEASTITIAPSPSRSLKTAHPGGRRASALGGLDRVFSMECFLHRRASALGGWQALSHKLLLSSCDRVYTSSSAPQCERNIPPGGHFLRSKCFYLRCFFGGLLSAIHTHTYSHTHTLTHSRTHALTHTHARTHTHTHTQTDYAGAFFRRTRQKGMSSLQNVFSLCGGLLPANKGFL